MASQNDSSTLFRNIPAKVNIMFPEDINKMAVLADRIRKMHPAPLSPMNFKYLATHVFDGEVNIPHFELLPEMSDGKLMHNRGFGIFFDPRFKSSLDELIDARTDPRRTKDVIQSTDGFEGELRGIFSSILRGDSKERGVGNLFGPACARLVTDIMAAKKLNVADRMKIQRDLEKTSNSALNGMALALRRKFPDYNPNLLLASFKNRFLYLHLADALMSGNAGITEREKKDLDQIVTDFFKDMKNHSDIFSNHDLMSRLHSLNLIGEREDPDQYLARLATIPHEHINKGIFPVVISPPVLSILFNTRNFPKFTELMAQRLGAENGKIESLKNRYEEFANAVYEAAIISLITRRIKFLENPGQINFGRHLVSPLGITSPIIGYDIVNSTPVVNALGELAPTVLEAVKMEVDSLLEAHEIEYLNDMGDGQFHAAGSVKAAITAGYKLFREFSTPKFKDEVIKKAFESEVEILAAGMAEEMERQRKINSRINDVAEKFGDKDHIDVRVARMMNKAAAEESNESYGNISEMKSKFESASTAIRRLYPGIRITIVYDQYKMPKGKHSTATGKAAYRVNRALGSEKRTEGQAVHSLVEVRQQAHGSRCVHHEGILLLNEPINTLKKELGEGNFNLNEELTRAYRERTGNNDAVGYTPKGLEYQGEQLHIMYLGKADIKSYPNEDIWSVLSEEDTSKYITKPIQLDPALSLSSDLGFKL